MRAKSWSPYLVGALIGVLSWFAFATADHPLGITTAFENSAALTYKAVDAEVTTENPLFADRQGKGKSPKIGWEWMLVLGVFLGAFASSRLSGDRQTGEHIPELWRRRFGDSAALRYTGAFLAGAVMMLGARIAQGCTSGHGISGTLQLAVSSWAFVAVAFPVAIATAHLVYRQEKGQFDVRRPV